MLPWNPYDTQSPQNDYNPYYQIKPDDTYDSIAQQTGVNASDLQSLNGVVPPPKGSFIRMPSRLDPLGGVGGGARGGNRAGAPGGPGNPALAGPNVREQAYSGQAQTPVPGTPGYIPPTAPATYSASYADPAWVANALSTGNFPNVLSASVANRMVNKETNQPYTAKDWEAAGYTYNAATGQYLRGGATGNAMNTPTANTPVPGVSSAYANTQAAQYYAANNVSFYAQKRWVKGRGFVTIGQLIREGSLDIKTGKMRQKNKGRGGGGEDVQAAPPTPAEATNSGTSPTRIYRTNQGGG